MSNYLTKITEKKKEGQALVNAGQAIVDACEKCENISIKYQSFHKKYDDEFGDDADSSVKEAFANAETRAIKRLGLFDDETPKTQRRRSSRGTRAFSIDLDPEIDTGECSKRFSTPAHLTEHLVKLCDRYGINNVCDQHLHGAMSQQRYYDDRTHTIKLIIAARAGTDGYKPTAH